MRRLAQIAAAGVGLLVLVLALRTLGTAPRSGEAVAPAPESPVPVARIAEHLAQAIRIPTISEDGEAGGEHAQAFDRFVAFLVATYPQVHAVLEREVLPGGSLLYRWPGRDANAPGPLVAAHHDVVPIDPGTEDRWTRPPWSGDVVDGVVWGRGTLDDKGSLICILEAVESLIAEGFTPATDVWLAFGHDEEIGGHAGARVMAQRLGERGIRLASVLDEGGAVVSNMVSFVDAPLAVVGIAEKGAISLRLSVEASGGHSSTPPPQSAIGILASAIDRLEANGMPARIDGTTRRFLESLGPELAWGPRIALANLWLTEGALVRVFEADRSLNAMVRTTTAATILQGGVKENVLPKQAHAVVNFRILPGDSVASVTQHVIDTIDDERIRVVPDPNASPPREPSPISPDDSPAFERLRATIHGVYPEAIVLPYLVFGGTDSRHYAGLTPNVYRFNPFRANPDTLKLLHGTDERIDFASLENGVRFYRAYLSNGPHGE